jgi:DNA polymerase III subunit delta
LAEVAQSELKPVYLLAGSDRPKIDRALARLRSRFPADASERLSATAAGGEDAVAACNAPGLFGGGDRLVEVTDVERWAAADAKAVAAYLKAPAPGTVLALVAAEMKRDSALAKACAQAGELLLFDVTKKELPKWVADQFARVGAQADPAACRALIELAGDHLEMLELEIEKLAVWADGQQIGPDDVFALVAARGEVPSFNLTDAWGKRDVAATLEACEAQLEHAADVRRELTRLVALLAGHVGRVRDCQRLEAEGKSAREAAAELKRHPFYVEKLFAQARNYGADELRRAIAELARLDLALKGGSRLPGELELTRTLVAITRPPAAQHAESG